MGTSGAYGGSAGWSGVGNQTQEWLDEGAGSQPDAGSDAAGDSQAEGVPSPDLPERPSGAPSLSPALTSLVSRLGRRLSSSGGGGGGAGAGVHGGSGTSGTATRGGGHARARASSIGGRAAAGVHGLRSGATGPLEELGLSLEELRGLPKHQQARRLLDVAMGPSGGVEESELRLANADLILWALNEEVEPSPIDLANRWVVEYVWQVWVSEAGPTIRKHTASGYDSHRVEQEMRAALEAKVAGSGLPDDRPLTARDFEQAIQSALKSLERIGVTSS